MLGGTKGVYNDRCFPQKWHRNDLHSHLSKPTNLSSIHCGSHGFSFSSTINIWGKIKAGNKNNMCWSRIVKTKAHILYLFLNKKKTIDTADSTTWIPDRAEKEKTAPFFLLLTSLNPKRGTANFPPSPSFHSFPRLPPSDSSRRRHPLGKWKGPSTATRVFPSNDRFPCPGYE